MRIQLLLLSAMMLVFAACSGDKKSTSKQAVTAPAAEPQIANDYAIPFNPVTESLIEGLWHIDNVFEREPTPRYQAQKGRYYNFEANGDYALFNPDGTLFHFGKWRYKPGDGDRNYISLEAEDVRYNNQWKVLMSREDAVFVGTELHGNTGVQQRLQRLTSLPASAIKAQQQ